MEGENPSEIESKSDGDKKYAAAVCVCYSKVAGETVTGSSEVSSSLGSCTSEQATQSNPMHSGSTMADEIHPQILVISRNKDGYQISKNNNILELSSDAASNGRNDNCDVNDIELDETEEDDDDDGNTDDDDDGDMADVDSDGSSSQDGERESERQVCIQTISSRSVETLTNMTIQNVMQTTTNMSSSRSRLNSQRELYVLLIAESMVDNAINNVLESLGMSPPGVRRIVNAGIATAIRQQGLRLNSGNRSSRRDAKTSRSSSKTGEQTTQRALLSHCRSRADVCSRLLVNATQLGKQCNLHCDSKQTSKTGDKVAIAGANSTPGTSKSFQLTKEEGSDQKADSSAQGSDPKGKRLVNGRKRKFRTKEQSATPCKAMKTTAEDKSCAASESHIKPLDKDGCQDQTAVGSANSSKDACACSSDQPAACSHGFSQHSAVKTDVMNEKTVVDGCLDPCFKDVEDEALMCAINEQGLFMK